MQNRRSEELIRRYLEGEMSVAEEHDFLIDVAVDRDLRLELSAQQTIDRALVKDRPTIDPEQYELLQQRVAGLIETIPVPRSLPSLRIGMVLGALLLLTGFSLFLLRVDSGQMNRERPQGVEQTPTSEVEAAPARSSQPANTSEIEAGEDGERGRERAEMRGGTSGSVVDRPGSFEVSRKATSRVPTPTGLEDLPPGIGPVLPTSAFAGPATTMFDTGSVDRGKAPKASDSIDLDLRVEWDLPE